ncbi:MAG: hypothetical protein JG767_931 [Deferribacteraceae bacterium]|jgi:hypothetical protein|nr:hypothetical protein [Deferribacteraceae bacterium]
MDKNVFNKQQVLSGEVGTKLQKEKEIVLKAENTQSKLIGEKEKEREFKQKKKNRNKEKTFKRKKFIEEEQGKIIDFKG